MLLQFRTLFDRQKTSTGTNQIGVGFSQRIKSALRLAFVDFAHLSACRTTTVTAAFNRAAACHAFAALVAETTHKLRERCVPKLPALHRA